MSANTLEIDGLCVGVRQADRSSRRVVDDVSFSIAPGKMVALVGESGSGKTTLLSILGCMLTPTEGTVRVRGDSIAGKNPEDLAKLRRENIGFARCAAEPSAWCSRSRWCR